MRKSSFIIIGLIILSFVISAAGQQQAFRLQTRISGLSNPLFVTNSKDNTKRIFVVEQGGAIKVLKPGETSPTLFMNISSVISSGGERGLLGLAFHPQFATNSFFFVNYTRSGDGATVIARYKAINNNTQGDPNSAVILLTIPQPYSNHNGGMIEFGPDNNLYIGMGDGGSSDDPQNYAQNINSLLGKFLRITPSLAAAPPSPAYTIPPDNPYVGVAGADEIYAVGVRNPFRWSFDRGGTRQLWAGDVGQGAIEETDIITRGGNYGWRVYEGNSCTNNDPGLCTPSNYLPPVFQYTHAGGRCSITGGYVYRGGLQTFGNGNYLYGDYCSGEILRWNGNAQLPVLSLGQYLTSFGEDENGEIYAVGYNSTNGTVRKLARAQASADFDGDAKTDFSVFRPSVGAWFIQNSTNNSFRGLSFGLGTDIPVPEDYDGDNITDVAVYRPSDGGWYFLRSSDNSFGAITFGASSDIPVAGDYDGDNKSDFVVFRPSEGNWYRLNSSNNNFVAVTFGAATDKPIPADFDGDGRTDVSVFRPGNGTWYSLNSADGAFYGVQFGANGDIPVVGDYDGDGRADRAVFRNGYWYILQSFDGSFKAVTWGAETDIPVAGDYDGDGKTDAAVYRPSTGSWYVLQTSNNAIKAGQFGVREDIPLPKLDIP